MDIRANEKVLEDFLDERYYIANLEKGIPSDIVQANLNYYYGAYAAVSQIANVTREKGGRHKVWIKDRYERSNTEEEE